ncbi:hypothetical protein, partial [Vibrio sp. 1565-1]
PVRQSRLKRYAHLTWTNKLRIVQKAPFVGFFVPDACAHLRMIKPLQMRHKLSEWFCVPVGRFDAENGLQSV